MNRDTKVVMEQMNVLRNEPMSESEKKCNLNMILKADMTHPVDASQYSPLVLAYLGDAVYTLIVRERQVREGNRQVNKLNRESINYVQASAQAQLMKRIEPLLSDEERAIYKRGRNATSHTTPKNQSVGDYRIATGFEALIGWLYLKGETERIIELINN